MAEPPVPIDDVGQEGEPLGAVAVVCHDGQPGIAPAGDVVHRAGEFEAERTGHGAAVYLSQCEIERPDPVLFTTSTGFVGMAGGGKLLDCPN